MKRDPYSSALKYAQRLLAIKDRSQREIENRLRGKGYGGEKIGRVIEDLRRRGAIDDGRLAREWIKASSAYRPKGLIAIKDELAKKGIDKVLIEEALRDEDVGYDEYKAAKALADKKMGSLRDRSEVDRKKDVYGYLARRGFSFDVINDIIDGI